MLNPSQFLKKAVELGRIPHALLFYGQDYEEKMASALDFVKLINGQEALEGVKPDLILIEPKEDKKEIEILQIRELQSRLSLKSYSFVFLL